MFKAIFTYEECGKNYKQMVKFDDIELTPARCRQEDGTYTELPTDLYVNLYSEDGEEVAYLTYNLDGTYKTFSDAIDNYNKVFQKLLDKGYIDLEEDFENATLFG